MKKVVYCKNCKSEIKIKEWADNRLELIYKKGESFEAKCKNCGNSNNYLVKEVHAKSNYVFNTFLFIFVLGLMVGIGYYLFSKFWAKSFYMVIVLPMAISIPGMIYFNYIKIQNKKISIFNRY